MDIQEMSRVKRNKERKKKKKKSQTTFLEQRPQNSKYPAL